MRRERAIAGWVLALAASLAAAGLAAPAGAVPPPGPHPLSWEEVGKLPDFTTGIWEVELSPAAFRSAVKPVPTPAYAAEMQAHAAAAKAGAAPQEAPSADCLPPGMPMIMTQPYPVQFLFGPREVTLDIEAYMQVRHIYTDGRPLPDDPDLTFNGSSIGHWEGRTLVVDTVGFSPATALNFDWSLHHSDQMRINERFTLTDPDTLELVTTVTDPKALARPWVSTTRFKRHPKWSIAEYICEQNNRNALTATGQAHVDLQPPPQAH